MAGSQQRQLSTGRLVRPASQGGRRPTGLLSTATVEHLRDPLSQKVSRWASSPAGRTPSAIGATGSRPSSRTGSRPQSRQSSGGGERTSGATLVGRTPVSRARMVWSPQELDLPELCGSTSRHDRSISWCTKRENISKEQLSVKLDSSQDWSSSGPAQHQHHHHDAHLESPSGGKETIESVTAAFKEEAAEVDRRIADLGNRLLMNHMSGNASLDAETKAREEREAEKKKRARELTIARLKEKSARDPHKKIQLKLENKRRFEMDTLDKAGIPTTNVTFQNNLGCETIKLVDVLGMQGKCTGLREGVRSVQELVDIQQRREKSLRLSTATASVSGSLMMSTSMPSFLLSDDTLLPSQMSWEERNQKASRQRRSVTSENIVRKLNSMRNPPARLPQAYDVFEHCDPDTRGDWENDHSGRIMLADSKSISLEEAQASSPSRRSPSGEFTCPAAGESQYTQVPPERIKKAAAPVVNEEVRKRVRHLSLCFRGYARFLMVVFAHKRRLDSCKMVSKFLLHFGEWCRMKSAMKRMSSSVVALQRMVRGFFSHKARRCEIMTKEWQRVEDIYLQGYFKLYAFRCMEDRAKQVQHQLQHRVGEGVGPHVDGEFPHSPGHTPSPNKSTRMKQHQLLRGNTQHFVDSALDWKSMRIPSQTRNNIISRYYMVLVGKNIRVRGEVIKAVRNTVEYQKDLAQLLKFFGSSKDEHSEELAAPALSSIQLAMPEFWHIKEDAVISLICMAADQLKKSIEMFKEHPGNKCVKLTESEFDKYCRPPRCLTYEVTIAMTAELEQRYISRADLFRQAERHELEKNLTHDGAENSADAKGRAGSPGGKSNTDRHSVTFASEEGHRHFDMDDVWREFSPRLLHIVEKQTAEWRECPQEHDERLDDLRPERIHQLR